MASKIRTDCISRRHFAGHVAWLQRFGGGCRHDLLRKAAHAEGRRRGSDRNGFTNSQSQVTVTVSESTLSSPYPNEVTYVEVDITQSVPTYFLRTLGFTSLNVGARAVSGAIAGPACIYALDPTDSQTFSLTGNANVTAQCGLIDDSSSSSGLYLSGNITLKATTIGVSANGFSESGNITLSPQPVPNVAMLANPLAARAQSAAPSVGTYRRRRRTCSSWH
jgi:hypothetical protein